MTKEQLEGNILIAKFLGWKLEPLLKGYMPNLNGKAYNCTWGKSEDEAWIRLFRKIRFHSSWDRLMPVYEKIWEITLKEIDPDGKKSTFFNQKHTEDNQFKSNIDESFNLIVEFIKWYNDNKRTNKNNTK